MEEKRAVSRSTQIAMEAFAPWVQHRLNDLLGRPQEDERREVVVAVDKGLDGWTKHWLVGALRLTENYMGSPKDAEADLKTVLVPWIEHQLIDLLWSQEKAVDNIVADVKSKFGHVYTGKIDVSNLKLSGEDGYETDHTLVSQQMQHHLDAVLSTLLDDQLSVQLKIERPGIVDKTRTNLKAVLKIGEFVLEERGNHEEMHLVKREAAIWEWVDDFVSVSYEIVAVLEEWKSSIAKVSSSVQSRSASKLKEINVKLDSLLKCDFPTWYPSLCRRDVYGSVETSSDIDESEVRCREHDIESVVKKLMLPRIEGEKAVKVMSIVGCGGSGKTSLARFVFNDPAMKERFELRAWGSVSNVFDQITFANYLLHSIGKQGVWNSVALFQQVEKSFSGKVFLCVIDDLWTEDSGKWMRFASLLRNGAPVSRILVTTRSAKTAQTVVSDWEHHLEPLTNKDWWLIWRDCLELSGKSKISKQMVSIGSNIADRCHRWPLAATASGEILSNKKSAEEWQGELKKVIDMGDEIWRMEDVAVELFRHFHHSYQWLSPALKLCILYCADFDKGTVMIVDQLIRMWMAHGFLGDSCEEDDVKTKKGLEYFDDLASRSFFHELVRGSVHMNKITSCKLSDTFHDFIRYEARRDLAALSQENYSAVKEERRERHFHSALSGHRVPDDFNCKRWKGVIALVLSSSQLENVPNGVGELIRVQYLDLSNNPLKELPEAVCTLECLEYLDVHGCYLLSRLPRDLQKLKQLKHLRVDHTTDELHKRLPKGFEELTLIRTLDVFRTGGSSYKDAMEKLKKFTHLTDICISVHGEVKLSDADFHTKINLVNLELCFVEEGLDQEKMSDFMRDSNPPPNLVMLKLDNYPLMDLPKWILEDPLQLETLTRLSFRSALNITSFPALWKLPSLEFLWLYDIAKLKHIGREFFGLPDTLQLKTPEFPIDMEGGDMDFIMDDEEILALEEADKTLKSFPKLMTLRIECMKNLDKWQNISEDEKKESRVSVMPSLEELSTPGCPKLVEMPLCILRDTPWFKRTNLTFIQKNTSPPSQKGSSSHPKKKEKVTKTSNPIEPITPPVANHRQGESNGLPTSSDVDSEYMKLRKFVHDTYVTKGLTDHFEVSIPKGVLGNTEVIASLAQGSS